MSASTSGRGPRSSKREAAQVERRRRFDEYVARMLTDPPIGSTWHPLYRWPSDTDADYAARVAAHEAKASQTTGEHNNMAHRAG
ncbi:hypothetical protein [Gordonia sp. NB41Y]|uniref:hypothetical protein n=1 Tax=Gordonia sp. NB41Y TaxID=875808 RepID=UPI0002BFF4C3|nr:hypothetical protein [Gordonia sp. NB41Y]EMP14802.1 hypothetical protein ISGA_1052 [Gordonia sp. NB41Y]WLP92507.1 hypothetical protein Q9K23_09895 [Gordonia sp. NB41Y]